MEFKLDDIETIDEIREQCALFNEYSEEKLALGMTDEFITLYLDGRELTQGEIEVLERVKQLNREAGNHYL